MGLQEYKKKRSFNKTPEPEGKTHKGSEPLKFVIQKHHASHKHYDFRLEMEGVLKSWAVPKGPSLNPDDKRLAMMVEDHPFEYRNFEGIIPPGNYGAGTVIIWDEGTYEPAENVGSTRRDHEKALLSQLHKGNLKFIMNGQKLKGEFALVHTKRPDQENAWLLIKKKDKHARETDITKKDKSVVSSLTIEQVAKTSNKEWKSNRSATVKKKPAAAPPKEEARAVKSEIEIPEDAKKAPFPISLRPMLASLVNEPFDDPDWIFEIKWDGYRTVAFLNRNKVEIRSRNELSYNKKFYPVADALKELNLNAVIDGEIVALDDTGNADFQLLQAWQKTNKGKLVFYAFDILWLNGYSLSNLPLIERKRILMNVLPATDIIRYSDHVEARGKDFFDLASKKGLEGIMAKNGNSTYSLGVRTQQWLKIKTHRTHEAIICGFTEGRGSRKHFGALVLGIYEGDDLVYIGHTGSGFDEKKLKEVYSKLKKLVTDKSPFSKKPKTKMPVTWVKPELVCEVKFQEWTRDNALRIPIFLAMRYDKDPKEVKKEKAIPVDKALKEEEKPKKKTAAMNDASSKKTAVSKKAETASEKKKSVKSASSEKKPSAEKEKHAAVKKKSAKPIVSETTKIDFDPGEKKQELRINNRSLTFTNLDKLYWKKEKITKGDMLNYYAAVAEYILPYMIDRPQSLNRHPNGISGASFYQKNVEGKVPSWVKKHDYVSESDGEKKKFFVCTDEASLLYMANLGCIEMNPWHSRTQSPDSPDWCVIDLDPGEISFEKVIGAANTVKAVLDELKIDSYCKTSGSTGLHIYIPLGAKYSYDQSRQFAELIVTLVHDRIPSFTSLERNPQKRKKKIYLDYLQNRAIQTIAAPYSLRPKPGATVSMPLHWEEVKKGLAISDFDIHNALDRIRAEGDIFTPVLGKGIDLEKVLEAALG